MKSSYGDFRVQMSATPSGHVTTARGRGAVASVSRQASEFAVDVLRDGGNAFDAAFSLAFSLCVYHPQAGNLGGGGYLLFQEKGARTPTVFNYREEAPAGATRDAFLLPDGSPDPDKTAYGPASVCVPGTVKAFFLLHQRYGKLKAKDLLLAISRRAREGAYVTQYEADCLNRLAPKLSASPESKRIYVRPAPFKRGDLLPNPNLARTLEVLGHEGDDAFYRGSIAEQIVADLAQNGGHVTADDLANYAVREADPIGVEVGGRRVWTVPPEGGGALLVEILSILDRDEFRRLRPGSVDYYHYLAQASKIAFIDRLDYLGDVPVGSNPIYQGIVSGRGADRLFGAIDPTKDTRTDALARRVRESRGASSVPTQGLSGSNTTHFSVIDAEGNAVSNSYTMNLRYGSKWSVDGAGFLLNGSMDSFSFVQGKENYFGVIGSEPNLFAPRKRPASNMAPVLVTQNGQVTSALGTPGGPTIPTALAFVLTSTLLHGTPPEQAILAGRLHHQGWPDVLYREAGMAAPELLAELSAKGYAIKDKNELIGDIHGVFRLAEGLLAVSDYRREGQAAACG